MVSPAESAKYRLLHPHEPVAKEVKGSTPSLVKRFVGNRHMGDYNNGRKSGLYISGLSSPLTFERKEYVATEFSKSLHLAKANLD